MWIENWFSNFVPFKDPLAVDGLSFKTPEHFFAAMKTLNWAERVAIANAATPGQAKRLGRKATLRDDWDAVKQGFMRQALEHRLHDDEWVHKLLETGSEEIVEWNNWHDTVWGTCVCPTHNRKGQNLLGKLLMEMRDGLLVSS